MNSQNILYIFIALVIFNFLFTTVLDYLNDKNWKDEIPDDLKGFYDPGTYLKAKRYKIERGRLTSISSFLNLIFTLLMLYFYGYGFISDYAISLSDIYAYTQKTPKEKYLFLPKTLPMKRFVLNPSYKLLFHFRFMMDKH